MIVELSDPETDEDEIHVASTTGKIPSHWYNEHNHLGYDLDGKKVCFFVNLWHYLTRFFQIAKGKSKDKLDKLLDRMDNPNANRTVSIANARAFFFFFHTKSRLVAYQSRIACYSCGIVIVSVSVLVLARFGFAQALCYIHKSRR
jgi:hypothetical protein